MTDNNHSFHYMPNKQFKAGEIIFNEGDEPDGVYYLCTGSVEIFRTKNGSEVQLAVLDSESVFGEMALIDNSPRSASVRAKTEVWCYKFSLKNFEHKLNQIDPLMRSIFNNFVFHIKNMNEKAFLAEKVHPE